MSSAERPSPVQLLPVGHEGRLKRPDGREVPVRVYERGNDALMLVVLLDADSGEAPEPIEPTLLEYTSAQGLIRVLGEAALEDHDLIRFRAGSPAEVLQRREFVRIDAGQPVRLLDERAGEAVSTHALDVSGGGMLVRGLEGVPEGHRLRFHLELGQGWAPLEGHARVVRTGERGERGVVFEDISSAERQRLIHFIFDRQRAALAKTRGGRSRRSA